MASERLPTKSGLRHRDHLAEAEIVRRHRAVGLLADDDEALFGAQDQQHVEPIDDGVELVALGPDRLPDARGRNRRAR